jgi:hypothetical protein
MAEGLLRDNMQLFVDDNLYNWFHPCINVKTTSAWENMSTSFASTRMWPQRHEGDPLYFTKFGDVDTRVFAMEQFQDGFTVTREYLEFGDPYTAVNEIFPRLSDWIPAFLERGLVRHSQKASEIFLDAFNGNIHTGLDNLPLASNVHPLPGGGTFDNMSGLPLSPAALTLAFNQANELVDEHGVPLALDYDTIIFGPGLRNTVATVLDNTVLPGGTNDENNVWYGRIIRRVENPWLIEAVQPGASQYWFLQASRRHTLKGYVAHMPTFLPEPKLDPFEMIMLAWTVFIFGWHGWQGMFCANGGS